MELTHYFCHLMVGQLNGLFGGYKLKTILQAA